MVLEHAVNSIYFADADSCTPSRRLHGRKRITLRITAGYYLLLRADRLYVMRYHILLDSRTFFSATAPSMVHGGCIYAHHAPKFSILGSLPATDQIETPRAKRKLRVEPLTWSIHADTGRILMPVKKWRHPARAQTSTLGC